MTNQNFNFIGDVILAVARQYGLKVFYKVFVFLKLWVEKIIFISLLIPFILKSGILNTFMNDFLICNFNFLNKFLVFIFYPLVINHQPFVFYIWNSLIFEHLKLFNQICVFIRFMLQVINQLHDILRQPIMLNANIIHKIKNWGAVLLMLLEINPIFLIRFNKSLSNKMLLIKFDFVGNDV